MDKILNYQLNEATNSAVDQLIKTSQNILLCAEKIKENSEPFERALSILYRTSLTPGAKIVITGVGKSSKIGSKLAATFSSTGTTAIMMHSTEAIHGDLGLVRPGDCIIAISYSGETEELLKVVSALKKRTEEMYSPNSSSTSICFSDSDTCSETDYSYSTDKNMLQFNSNSLQNAYTGYANYPIISLCGNGKSQLSLNSDVWLDVSVTSEASNDVPAPTISTTLALALGDVLAMNLMKLKGFNKKDFLRFHPGGSLGDSLRKSEQ
ncbi:putative phosphosugar isomerase [Smittium culicis]|uniref:Putative phosphosugar isomerase n=1 Tax=Smittium culicis TaxID=133412 RepID=A0A1R1Y8V4_9FUNG|nr:putative phosphosugar isomerase [Smittium culicis]